jgi:hypothetical protein
LVYLQASDGEVKYVCQHKVIGRVRVKRLLNPRSLLDRRSYLRAVVEDLTDADEVFAKNIDKQLSSFINTHTRFRLHCLGLDWHRMLWHGRNFIFHFFWFRYFYAVKKSCKLLSQWGFV